MNDIVSIAFGVVSLILAIIMFPFSVFVSRAMNLEQQSREFVRRCKKNIGGMREALVIIGLSLHGKEYSEEMNNIIFKYSYYIGSLQEFIEKNGLNVMKPLFISMVLIIISIIYLLVGIIEILLSYNIESLGFIVLGVAGVSAAFYNLDKDIKNLREELDQQQAKYDELQDFIITYRTNMIKRSKT